MADKLAGKGVLVTGGGSGIGLATVRLLLAEGARVAITGRNETKLRDAAAALNAGERVAWQAADLGDTAQVQRLVETVTARLGAIDILVNNAGLNIKDRQFAKLTPDTWRELLAGNLESAFYCTHAVLPQMRQRGGGLIIN